jgi:hypothetical protein
LLAAEAAFDTALLNDIARRGGDALNASTADFIGRRRLPNDRRERAIRQPHHDPNRDAVAHYGSRSGSSS